MWCFFLPKTESKYKYPNVQTDLSILSVVPNSGNNRNGLNNFQIKHIKDTIGGWKVKKFKN